MTISVVRTEFLNEKPEEFTTISGYLSISSGQYCKCWVTTTSGIFEELDEVSMKINDHDIYDLYYISYSNNRYYYVGRKE